MSSPFATYPVPERSFMPSNPSSSRGAAPSRGTGAKRGRKPKNRTSESPSTPSTQPGELQWMSNPGPSAGTSSSASVFPASSSNVANIAASGSQQSQGLQSQSQQSISAIPTEIISNTVPGATPFPVEAGASRAGTVVPGAVGADEDGEGEDEMLPAMADDDYSAQLSWQSQSKDNLKYVT